jgi:hypothetical protein
MPEPKDVELHPLDPDKEYLDVSELLQQLCVTVRDQQATIDTFATNQLSMAKAIGALRDRIAALESPPRKLGLILPDRLN